MKIKRIIGVIGVAVALALAGVAPVEAKAPKSAKTRTASGGNIVSSMETSTFFSTRGGITNLKTPSAIISNLKKMGCTLKTTTTEKTYDGDTRVTATKKVFTHNGTTISVVDYKGLTLSVEIRFADSGQVQTFLAQMDMEGWGYLSKEGSTTYYESLDGASLFSVTGRKVVLTSGA